MNRHFITALMMALVCSHSLSATAGVLFTETFDGPTKPSTLTYVAGGTNAWGIASQQLFCDASDGANSSSTAVTNEGFTDPILPITYSLDAGKPLGASAGGYNVGMIFGGYGLLFHPGHSGGTLRVWGGYTVGNTNMGFTPKLGEMHHVEVTTQPIGSGLGVDILIEGMGTDDLMHTFKYSFIDPSSNLGDGKFGGRRSGGNHDIDDAMFDNFQADMLPEPSSVALLIFGAIGLAFGRRRRRHA